MRTFAILLAACALLGCAGEVELRPELKAHLDEYESLIDAFEPKFANARADQAEFAKVAKAYSKEAKDWMSRWSSVAPEMSDAEGKAVKANINRLNRRAEKMLRGI